MSVTTDQVPHPTFEDMDLDEAFRLIDEYFDLLDSGDKRVLKGIDNKFSRVMLRVQS